MTIKSDRAEPDHGRLTEHEAAVIKGMLARGDKQSDIAACFLLNGGRISEINTGMRFAEVDMVGPGELPPPGPYPSPYELWRSKQEAWRARLALEAAQEAIQKAMVALHKTEQR